MSSDQVMNSSFQFVQENGRHERYAEVDRITASSESKQKITDVGEKMETFLAEQKCLEAEHSEVHEYMEIQEGADKTSDIMSTSAMTSIDTQSMSTLKSISSSSITSQSRETISLMKESSNLALSRDINITEATDGMHDVSMSQVQTAVESHHHTTASHESLSAFTTNKIMESSRMVQDVGNHAVSSSYEVAAASIVDSTPGNSSRTTEEASSISERATAPTPAPKSPKIIPPPALPDLPPSLDYAHGPARIIPGVRRVAPSSLSRKRPIPTVSFCDLLCHQRLLDSQHHRFSILPYFLKLNSRGYHPIHPKFTFSHRIEILHIVANSTFFKILSCSEIKFRVGKCS